MGNFELTKTYFEHICRELSIDVPRVLPALDTDPCDFTSVDEVHLDMKQGVEDWWHAVHVCGHYLCDLHEKKPDEVADKIGLLICGCLGKR